MTRHARLLIVVAVSLAIAATGLCSSLSPGAGAAASCPVAAAPQHDACCDRESGNDACPEAPARPTCRTCDGAVAFLLKDKTGDGGAPRANLAHLAEFAPRPAAAIPGAAISVHLSSLASSPPRHLLNVTFRN